MPKGALLKEAVLEAYALWTHEVTAIGKTYHGAAEKATFTFRTGPEQLSFIDNWLRNNLISNFKAELENEGARLLEITTYRDPAPFWHTGWRVEVIADVRGVASAGLGQAELRAPLWGTIIILALAGLIGFFVALPALESVEQITYGVVKIAPWLIIALVAFLLLSYYPAKTKPKPEQ